MNNRHSRRLGNYYSCLLEHESQTPNIIFRKPVDPVAFAFLGISRCFLVIFLGLSVWIAKSIAKFYWSLNQPSKEKTKPQKPQN